MEEHFDAMNLNLPTISEEKEKPQGKEKEADVQRWLSKPQDSTR